MRRQNSLFRTGRIILFLLILFGFTVTPVWPFQALDEEEGRPSVNLPAPWDAPERRPPDDAQAEAGVRELPPLGEIPPPPDTFRKRLFMVPLGVSPSTEDEAVDAVKGYLSGHPELLAGFTPKEIELTYVATVSDTFFVVQFVQKTPDDLPIAGSYAHFSVTQGLLGGRIHLYPDVATSLPPQSALSPAERLSLQAIGREALGLPTDAALIKEESLVRYIVDESGRGRWKRVHEMRFSGNDYTAVIGFDGTIIGKRYDILHAWKNKGGAKNAPGAVIEGTVKGQGVFYDPIATGWDLPTLDLKDLMVMGGGEEAYTDSTGNFSFPTLTSPATLTAKLFGRWANVTSETSSDLIFTGPATPGVPVAILFNPTAPGVEPDEFSTAQVNGYYHTTYIHDWVQARLPAPHPALDISLPVKVNVNDVCNASYDFVAINFFKSGGGCLNTAYDTTVYHEYGHFVDHKIGGITNTGLSEGWGDVLATFASSDAIGEDQPLIGENWKGEGTFVRTTDNDYQYPFDGIDESHRLGQAWAGFAWHFREGLIQNLGRPTGIQVADRLIIPTLLANSADIPSAVWDVVLLDDVVYGDGSFTNGTPHFSDIQDTASRLGLYPFLGVEEVAFISSPAPFTAVDPVQEVVTITGTADISSFGGLLFRDYQLYYGEGRNPTEWTAIGQPGTTPVAAGGTLGAWDIRSLSIGTYTLKVVVTSENGVAFQSGVQIAIETPPTQITNHPAEQRKPNISGNLIVWEDNRNGNWDIFLFDPNATPSERPIVTGTGYQTDPAISGNLILWKESGHLYLCEYHSESGCGPKQQITFNPAGPYEPTISGNLIAWKDLRNSPDSDVYFCEYDFNTGACPETEAVTDPTAGSERQKDPAVSENRVVWTDDREGKLDIFLRARDPDSGVWRPEQQITENPETQIYPAISGDRVVWSDPRNGNRLDIYSCLYNPDTGGCPDEPIATDPSVSKYRPGISGNWIVWENVYGSYGTTNYDLHIYSLLTKHEEPFATDPKKQSNPAISGRGVVWEDYRNNNADIYFKLANHSPELRSIGKQWVRAGDLVEIFPSASDVEDSPDELTYSVISKPQDADFDPAIPAFRWTTGPEDIGLHEVTFRVVDSEGAPDAETVLIKVVDKQGGGSKREMREE